MATTISHEHTSPSTVKVTMVFEAQGLGYDADINILADALWEYRNALKAGNYMSPTQKMKFERVEKLIAMLLPYEG